MIKLKTLIIVVALDLVPAVCNATEPLGLRVDPIESDPSKSKILQAVDEKIKERGLCKRKGLGSIHCVWNAKKQILKNEYGIEWKSPEELNPGAIIE